MKKVADTQILQIAITLLKPMKILIPSYDFKPMLGGVANYVHEVSSILSTEHNAQVTVIARQQKNSTAFDTDLPYKVLRISSPATAYLSQLPFILKNVLELSRFDRIICPLWFPDGASQWWAQKLLLTSVPTYITVHASELFEIQNSFKNQLRHLLVNPLQKPIFNTAKGIFAVSNYTGNCIREKLSLPQEKIHVIPNGVNLKFFSPLPSKPISSKLRLLTVTRLMRYKGIDTVLHSLAQVKTINPLFIYTIIGSGPDRKRLENLVTSLGLTQHVVFKGSLEQKDIIDHYQNSDLFIMMSRYEHPDVEGFGLVFLEAAACGLPSIGGNSGGIPDALDQGTTGWLLDPINVEALRDKILHLMATPRDLEDMGLRALKAVQNKDWTHSVRKMWSVLS